MKPENYQKLKREQVESTLTADEKAKAKAKRWAAGVKGRGINTDLLESGEIERERHPKHHGLRFHNLSELESVAQGNPRAAWSAGRDPILEDLVAEVMSHLSPDHRDLLRRYFHEQQRQVDIAKEDGRSQQAVSTQLRTALKAFEKKMRELAGPNEEDILAEWRRIRIARRQ